MTNEHNQIAHLVTRIQQKWAEEISPFPGIQFVRWLINPDDSELYEGFLRLESSPFGKLPDIFVTLLTPFESKDTYSKDLINSWFQAIDNDKKTFDQLASQGTPCTWDYKHYKDKSKVMNGNADAILLEIVSSFHKSLNLPDRPLTIALFQYSITSPSEFAKWIRNISEYEIPAGVRFCIFDLKDEKFYDRVFNAMEPGSAKTIMVPIDLQAAIKKMIQAGDPNDPGVRLHKYIQQMTETLSQQDITKLHRVGKECIEDMARSKQRSLMATAHLVYAGMLFNFKDHFNIENILKSGLRIAEAGKSTGDQTCQSLIPQYYSFMASNFQLSKKFSEAINWFCKSAECSLTMKQAFPAISSYRQASFLAQRHESYRLESILASGYNAGADLKLEEIKKTDYGFLCVDYYEHLYHNRKEEKAEEVDLRMKTMFGNAWKESIRDSALNNQEKVTV